MANVTAHCASRESLNNPFIVPFIQAKNSGGANKRREYREESFIVAVHIRLRERESSYFHRVHPTTTTTTFYYPIPA